MFDRINGLPAHPLVVHGAVVLIPLLCLAALAYALVPRVRRAVGWVAVGLAVVAPVLAWLATTTGEGLGEEYYPQGLTPQVVEHEELGNVTLYASLGLGLGTLLLVYVGGAVGSRRRQPPTWVAWGLSAIVVVLAAVTGYYVVRTGDSGAASVWGS